LQTARKHSLIINATYLEIIYKSEGKNACALNYPRSGLMALALFFTAASWHFQRRPSCLRSNSKAHNPFYLRSFK